jgi:hypothetical protein
VREHSPVEIWVISSRSQPAPCLRPAYRVETLKKNKKNGRRDESDDPEFDNTEPEVQPVRTSGTILKNGSVLDLVAPVPGDQPQLITWNGENASVTPRYEDGVSVYLPSELHPTCLRALLFPRRAVSYGTSRMLFEDLTNLFQKYLFPDAQRMAFWVIADWVSDVFRNPLMLWISAAETARAITLFSLLRVTCRRALILAGLTAGTFPELPMDLWPTLLVNQPRMRAGLRSLLRDSSFSRVVIPLRGGAVLEAACPKAIFVESEISVVPRGNENIHIALPPTDGEGPSPDECVLGEIADYFQPRLLQYRFDLIRKVGESRFAVTGQDILTRELASMLNVCIQGDSDLKMGGMHTLLEGQEAMPKSCTVESGIVEALWPLVHQLSPGLIENAPTEIQVTDLTDLVNTVLRAGGEVLKYSAVEVGAKLSLFGFSTKRRSAGNFVQFDQNTRHRVHQYARTYKVGTPVAGCLDCPPPAASENSASAM